MAVGRVCGENNFGNIWHISPYLLIAEEIFLMATLGGAKALGLEDSIGEIKVGKRADIVAIKEDGLIDSFPNYNFISNLIYSQSSQKVDSVWVDGKRVLEEGSLLTLQKSELLTKTRAWQEKLSQK